ncbi:hypothetical protein SEUCBS139899_009461 [Sporothrix eucalyptigena]|uniref:HNH nuclease domain-containing protein n=1 Tax=Sporothrix eucalyptigena TaxID=1812306 RepID=A0ABP0CWA2_9PEZI
MASGSGAPHFQELYERAEIAKSLLKYVSNRNHGIVRRTKGFTAAECAILATTPLAKLKKLGEYLDESRAFYSVMKGSLRMVASFIHAPDTGDMINYQAHPRRAEEAEVCKCLQRDNNKCILTGAPGAKAFPIVTIFNHADEHLHSTLLKSQFTILPTSTRRHFLDDTRRYNNYAWNMLSLSPAMHNLWKKGYFGLRFVKLETITKLHKNGRSTVQGVVHIEFHWLPLHHSADSTNNSDRAMWNDIVPVDKFLGWLEQWDTRPRHDPSPLEYAGVEEDKELDGFIDVPRPVDKELDGFVDIDGPVKDPRVMSGTIFTVTLPSYDEARKMAGMLNCQWVCQKVASMCGGVGNVDFYRGCEWERISR